MSKFSSLFTTILGVLGCSAAVALQPTVRAGSLSLNSAVKPTAVNVTSTVATQSTATSDASRGSALSKFSPAIVPVSRTNDNNNQNVNSAVLDELRQEIAELTAAQNSLRDNQLSRSDVEDTVEDAVKGLNLTTTDLRNTISDLQSSNQSLQTSIDSLTNRTENLEDTENGAVVNILKVRGLINSNNTVPFALKTEIEPTALAQKIVTDASATATLADKIQPKDTDIRDIITDELTEVGVLKNGALDVEKKGEVQVTEATVTNALRDSSNFKQMVSDEIATKGYVTDTALNDRDFVTNDALNNKKFLSTDSVAFSKLATKDEIAPAAIAASIADSESAKQVLSGKIGPDESSVKGLIFDELKKRDIVDASDNLKLATANDVSVESLTDKLDNVFAGKNEVPTVDEETVSAALANSTTLDDTIIRNLKDKHLLKDSGDLNVATNDSVSTLSSRVAVLDGGINDDGSLLNIIAKDETLKELLRGKDGKDGTSYKLKGSVETYENLVKNNVTQIPDIVEGDGYFTQDTGKLYVYNCDSSGNNCNFPAEKDGIELKGEKGDPGDPGVSAETTWHSYCTTDNNLNNIIKPLYGTSKTCDNFTEEEYIALMDGSKAYCMLVAKNAKENSNYLVATKGIGKTLEDIFGSGTVSNLKNNGLSASVSINGQSEKFVFACAKKYDEIMNPKSAWYSYCSEGTNLTSIIQPLYGTSTVKTCDDFTQEQYNAIMGGPKAYCLMVAKNVDSSTLNVKNNLKRLFGDTIVSTLSSQKVATKVTLNNQTISFVDACAQKYEEIMAGKSGEGYTYRGTIDNYSELSGKSCDAEHEGDAWYNLEVGDALLYICACNDEKNSCSFPAKGRGVNFKGEPGENGKPASQIYCEAHAVNYPDDVTNLSLIQKLYPNKGISSCDPSVFTQDLYAAIIGGANAYCTSLNATFNTGVSLNDGVGLKLAKIYATKKSVSLSSAKDALRTLQTKDAKERMNDSDFSILDECIANYNSIMSGDDGDTAWYAYCMEQDDKGVSNLTKIITPLYSNIDSCDKFTSDLYNSIMGGAKSYCLSLVQKVDTLDLNAGIGQKLVRTFGSEKMQNLKATSTVQGRLAMTGFKASSTKTNTTFMEACEARYNEIMSGTSTEQQYCEDNIEIVKKLYSKITSKEDCADKFTNTDYTAIMGGSTAYCLSLVQNPTVLDLTEGIGKRMSAKLGSAKMAAFVDTTTYTTPQSRMAITGFAGKSSNNADFMTACKERYDEIMAGDDGDDGESAAYTWCKAHVVATGFRTVQNVKKMSAAKTINAFVANNSATTGLTKSNNEGYFTSMDACLAAVEADPSLMGGETAEESKFNADVAEGKKTFALNDDGKAALISTRTSFVNDIKGESFTPLFDASTGMLSWTGSKGTNVSSMKVGQTANDIQNSVGTELIGLGFAERSASGQLQRATSIVTTTDLNDEDSAAGQALRNAETSRLANLGLVTVTGTGANQSVKSNVVTTNNLSTTMTNAGFAKASDVVSTANFATQLQSSLNNTNVKNALTSAGFATKDDTSSQVVTMKDLSQLLSGGLVVDSAGNVKLDSSANNINANAISSKLTAAKQKDSSIGTAKIRAESNIAASVANIAVTAATANAAANENIDLDQEKCNQTDYMVWNEYAEEGKGMCEKCPDESVFSNSKGTTPSSRCKCDDPAKKVAYDEGEQRYMCVDAGNENACLAEPDTYWNGTKCNKCPEGTYFNEESMENSSLPRCVCEDKSATFNTSTGSCVAAGQSECASNNMIWSQKDQSCVECPPNAPFNAIAQECVCEDTNLNFDKTQMACIYCEPGTMFSASEGTCIDANKETCAINNHYFWHTNDEKCYICPEYAPYNATAGGCACKDGESYFDTRTAECRSECPDGAHYEPSLYTCVCDDVNLSINSEEFKCM